MITEYVLFAVPPTMSRAEVVAAMRAVAPKWRANAELIRKTFLYDADARVTGAYYLWKDKDAAQRAHDDAWRAGVRRTFGSEPVIRYFETPLVIDNAADCVIDAEAGAQAGKP